MVDCDKRPGALLLWLVLACVAALPWLFPITQAQAASPTRSDGPATVAPASGRPPNIIMIVADALRADHVSAYGYGRQTTPNLDSQVADKGVRFADVTSPSPWTYPANAALLTGRLPSDIGVAWNKGEVLPPTASLLAEHMRRAGYYTAGFNGSYFTRAALGFSRGFDVYQEVYRSDATRPLADEINGMAENWLDVTFAKTISGTKPLFLFLYYFDPHTWYNSPPPYDTLYDPTYTGSLTGPVYADGVDVASGAIVPSPRDVEHLLALYDGDITYWDVYLGKMLAHLEMLGLLDNSIVVVTSDHGEMFGEHGKWTHRNSLYEETLRVPLLMRYDGIVPPGRVVTASVQTLDVLPTILEWLKLPKPPEVRGASLAGLAAGTADPVSRDIYAEVDIDTLSNPDWFAPRVPLRSIRRDGWKLIHPLGVSSGDELYQVAEKSLYEGSNLVGTQPARAQDLLRRLAAVYHMPSAFAWLPVLLRP